MSGEDPNGGERRVRPDLLWRCRRGVRELDLLLAAYLAQRYPDATEGEQAAFERLLDWPDDVLARALLGVEDTGDGEMTTLASAIRDSFAR